jgi:hypothetical protein
MAKKIKQDKPICNNEKIQEFEYQANLLKKIIEGGYTVRGNVSAVKNNKKSIFDLVVFKGDPVLILETKNTEYKALLYGKISAQIKKYQEYGLPILVCTPLVEDDFILKIIKKAVNKTFLTNKDKRYKNMKVVY